MVTSLRFVSDYGDNVLSLYNPITVKQTPVGPKGEALLFDMKAGEQKDFTDSVMVQVSPAGATLTKDQLTLINSQLGTIDEFVSISKVEAYKGLLTRAVSNNGLYVVYFTQNPDYDFKADADQAKENKTQTNFAKATKGNEGKGGNIRFAIALTEENEAGTRDVMTPYDLTVNGGAIGNTMALNYTVDNTPVANIHNRFLYAADGSSFMYVENSVSNPLNNMTGVYGKATSIASFEAAIEQGYAPVGDYAWNDKGVAVYDGNTGLTSTPSGDNRTAKPFYPVEEGEPFTVAVAANNIYGYYVTIDTYRATESGESEIAAWTKYAENIDGINKVYRDGEIELTINKEANVPAGDVIGFRVWAVNYDGTLVDPDGRAFYVQVGDAANVKTTAISATIPVSVDANKAPYIPVATVASYDDVLGWTTAYTSVSAVFTMTNSDKINLAADKNSTVTITLGNGATLTAAMDGNPSAAATINASDYTTAFKNIKVKISDVKFVDGQTYNGQIVITGKNGLNAQTVQIIPVSIKKTVPTTLPASFSVAAGLTTAEADVNVYVGGGDVTTGVTAAFNNIFRMNNAPLNAASNQWTNFAFLIKLADATQATWSKPGDPAYYTNWTWNTTNPQLTFVGMPGQDNTGSALFTLNKTWTDLNTGLATAVTGKVIPTLDVVNGDVQTLSIFYQYDNISFKAASDKVAPVVGNVIASGSKTLKVQTYANTYTVNAPAMPTLTFGETAYLNYDAVTLSSSAISKIDNSTLSTVEAMAQNMKIQNTNIALTGDAAQYFTTSTTTITVTVDQKTGAVTYNGVAVSGVEVKNNGTAAAPNYVAVNGNSVKVIVFTPNTAMTNAPAGNLSGSLTLSYIDGFQLGSGFGYVNGAMSVLPYAKTYGITMRP